MSAVIRQLPGRVAVNTTRLLVASGLESEDHSKDHSSHSALEGRAWPQAQSVHLPATAAVTTISTRHWGWAKGA
jgi:hypothetical protein